MKRTLLVIAFAMFSILSFAQISAGETSDFEIDVEGWEHQIANANDPVQVADGGPNGAGDGYLSTSSTGGGGSGSRHVFANDNAEWIGNYTTAGIIAFTFDVRNTNATEDLHLRVGFNGTGFNDWAASTNAVVVSAGSGWTSVTIPVEASDLSLSGNPGTTVAAILANVTQVRILSNDGSDSLHKGQRLALTSDYDNIVAVDVLNTPEFELQNNEFTISPNPAKNRLNISIPSGNGDMKLEVYDVLGKRIYKGLLTDLESSINVTNWKTGVYLVKVSSDKISQTKRFIKQ
jgi:Secretion system C-terminal sorting domain